MPTHNCRATQKTLASSASLQGYGLHSGSSVRATLQPAPANSGVTWVRTDVPGNNGVIPARWDNVSSTRLSTVVSNRHGLSVSTIEHLMAALNGAGIDNARIEIDAPEVPIGDGSARPWTELIEQAGIVRLAARRRVIRILQTVEVRDGDSYLRVSPADDTHYSVEIDFSDPAIGRQRYHYQPRLAPFSTQIASARTFGFKADIESLRRQGLALGGSLDNAVVVERGAVLNPEGLRFGDEFVRHKLLDCIGDLYLAGAPIVGHIEGRKPGHRLNNRLLHALFSRPTAWEWEQLDCSGRATPNSRLAA